VLASLCGSSQALAQQSEQSELPSDVVKVKVETGLEAEAFPIDEKDPESSVPGMEQAMKHPLQMGYHVMLLIERGQAAMEREDYKAAIKFYRAMVKAIPERATPHGLLCKAYEAAGDDASALDACRQALARPSVTVDDNLRFIALMLRKPGKLEKKEVEDVDAVIAHLEKELSAPPVEQGEAAQSPVELPAGAKPLATPSEVLLAVTMLKCDLATRLEETPRLEQCSARLEQLAPRDARTLGYSWALQLNKGDYDAAEGVIQRAERLGVPEAAVVKMQTALRTRRDGLRPWQQWLQDWGLIDGLTGLMTALAAVLVLRRKKSVAGPQQLSHG
jgi:tetratricopeptide (TPR) repeat protein